MHVRKVVIAALASLAVAASAASAAPRSATKAPVKITVTAKEFSFTFTKASVPHGTIVIFTLINRGQLSHNLVFTTLNKGTPLLLPGHKATLKITFTKKGRYYYICSVPNHAEEGMAGSFVVT
jgi:plastocyanin